MKYLNNISIVINNDDIITEKMIFEKWDQHHFPLYKVKTANGNIQLLHLYQIKSIIPIHNQSLLITLFFNDNYYEIICDSIEWNNSIDTLCVINPTSTSSVLPMTQSFDSLSLETIEKIKSRCFPRNNIYYQAHFLESTYYKRLDSYYSALLNKCISYSYISSLDSSSLDSSIIDIINDSRIISIEILRCNREINPQKEVSSFYNTYNTHYYNDRPKKSFGENFTQIHIRVNFDDKKLKIRGCNFLREYSTRSMDYDEWENIDCLMIFQTRHQLRLYVYDVLDICKKDGIEVEYSKQGIKELYTLTSKGGYNWAEKFRVEFIYTINRDGTPR